MNHLHVYSVHTSPERSNGYVVLGTIRCCYPGTQRRSQFTSALSLTCHPFCVSFSTELFLPTVHEHDNLFPILPLHLVSIDQELQLSYFAHHHVPLLQEVCP